MKFTDYLRKALQPKPSMLGYLAQGVHLYGDSIMAGGIGSRLTGFGINVLDYAQPGDSSHAAWQRFPYDVRSMNIVVLEHGTNDITGGVNPVPYLKMMAERALAEGRHVIFTGIPQRELETKYSWEQANEDIEMLAWDLGCPHAYWQHIEYSSADRLHPDSAMADRLAQQLVHYIL